MAGQWYTLGIDVSGIGSGLASATNMLGKFGLAVDGVQRAWSLTTAGLGVLNRPIRLAAEFESTTAAIRTMVGDIKIADALLAQIEKYADTTSFEFPELANATKMLLGFGVAAGDVRKELGQMGDLAAGLSVPVDQLVLVFGQAKAAGQLMGGDMLQLSSKGIAAYEIIGKIIGKTTAETKKLGEEGKLTFPLLQEAFRRLTAEGGKFHKMTEQQAQTTLGRYSTLTDGIAKLQRQLGQPINDLLRPMMKEVNEKYLPVMIQKFGEAIEGMRAAASRGQLGELLRVSMINGMSKVANVAEGIFNWLPKLLGVGLEFGAKSFASIFTKEGLGAIGKMVEGLIDGLIGTGDLIRAALGEPMREIGASLTALIDIAAAKWNKLFDENVKIPSYKEAANEAYEASSPKQLEASGESRVREAGSKIVEGIMERTRQMVEVAKTIELPVFQLGTMGNDTIRATGEYLARAQREGAAVLEENRKANEKAAKKLAESATPEEQRRAGLKDATSTANAGKAGKSGGAGGDGEGSGSGSGSGGKYLSIREQREAARADRLAQRAARSSKGYSREAQYVPPPSALGATGGSSRFNPTTGQWEWATEQGNRLKGALPARDWSPPGPLKGAGFGSLDYLRGSGLQGFAGARALGRRGQEAASGLAQEGADRRTVARVTRRQDTSSNGQSGAEKLLGDLVAVVKTMQADMNNKLGVA